MSYCRFSSMNHGCDVYVYADAAGGYTCHVAANKRVSDKPCPEIPRLGTVPVWQIAAAHDAQLAWCDDAQVVPIGLSHDGASFRNLTRDEMVGALAMLKAEGYRMPDGLVDDIAMEAP